MQKIGGLGFTNNKVLFANFDLPNIEISEMRRPIGAKFCTVISTKPNFIMPVQNFGGGHPPAKKKIGPKTCKIWPRFGRLRSLALNISGTDKDIQSRTRSFCSAIPPALGEQIGEHWSTNLGYKTVKSYPPKSTFSDNHISAPKGCCAPNFLHALENDVLLAHLAPAGNAGPFTIFFQRRSKIGLKFSL